MNQEPSTLIEQITQQTRRIVVKVGTRVIDGRTQQFNIPVMEALVDELAALRQAGIEVILVSSGAVGAGLRTLSTPKRPASVPLRQAYAAVGQSRLMQRYSELFEKHGLITAQVLLTRSDLDRRESYLNARETLQHLLTIGVIPIINENDTVSVEELTFGDNDMLAALVAGKLEADLLVLLTTVDGLYRDYDEQTKTGELIEYLTPGSSEADAHILPNRDPLSMGGMQSKIDAAKRASSQGVLAAIANGLRKDILHQLLRCEAAATWILPCEKKLGAWKYYLAHAKQPCSGQIVIDEGAVLAIRDKGKSLLASGVQSVEGGFQVKDLVRIVSPTGDEVARGLVNYSAEELATIRGQSSQRILEVFQDRQAGIVVHRNNMVLAS